MLIVLDFDLQSETSITFMERFIQLFLLDEGLFSQKVSDKERQNDSSSDEEDVLVEKKFS